MEEKELDSAKGFVVISPLDWALIFAKANFSTVLPILVLMVSAQTSLVYLRFTESLSRTNFFLIGIAESLLSVWFITAVVYIAVRLFKKMKASPIDSLLEAFPHIPKVFLSYICVLMVVGVSLFSLQGVSLSSAVAPAMMLLLALPLLVASGYLLWAPLYCAAEGTVPHVKAKAKVDDDDPDWDEDEIREQARIRFEQQFKEKMPWELGFARSVRLAGQNLGTTYTAVLLLATANFLPQSIISFFLPAGLARSILEIAGVGLLNGFVFLLITAVFLVILTKEGKDELGIAYYIDPRDFLEKGKEINPLFQERRSPYILLVLVFVASFSLVLKNTFVAHAVPEDLQVKIEQQRFSGAFYTLTVELEDKSKFFQWYRSEGFRLSFAGAEEKEAAPIEPLEVVTIDERGEATEELIFAPRVKPVRVRIVFKVPREKLVEGATWELQFADLFGKNIELTTGSVAAEIQ